MRTALKNEIKRLLTDATPMSKICYCAGQYSKVIEGIQYPITKQEALRVLQMKPQPELILITVDERRFSWDTKVFEGPEPDNSRPEELRGFKLQKYCVDDPETITTLLELQNGISRNK